MKNFHMDLVRVTEAGAIAAAKWVGRGDKKEADYAATEAMEHRLAQIEFLAQIAIGEGKKDESYGLFEGQLAGCLLDKEQFFDTVDEVGNLDIQYDIAVDPIEGTTPTAKGGYEAISVIAMANAGSLYKTECFYMDKIAIGPHVVSSGGVVGLDFSAKENIESVAKSLGKSPQHVTVCVMDRDRTKPLIKDLREIGCRIKFISDCDVTACIAACEEDSGIDMYWSIGGAPEAVIAACAMKCMGGFIQCREVIKDTSKEEEETWVLNNSKLLEINDLASGEVMFAATGITDGSLLEGVRFTRRGPITNSIGMRSGSGTIRKFTTNHGN